MKTETLELTKTELDYLFSLVHDHIEEGYYWGNKVQFQKMQNSVLKKIEDAEEAYDTAFKHKVKC
jgi:hypothetical protein